MAPAKSSARLVQPQTKTTMSVNSNTMVSTLLPLARKGLTRRAAQNFQDQNADVVITRGKRKAEHSPEKKHEKVKRSALGNLTDNVKVMTMTAMQHIDDDAAKQHHHNLRKKELPTVLMPMQLLQDLQNIGVTRHPQQSNKITTRAATRNAAAAAIKIFDESSADGSDAAADTIATTSAVPQPKKEESEKPLVTNVPAQVVSNGTMKAPLKPVRRISNEFNKTEESLYISAVEDLSACESMRLSGNFEAAKRRSMLQQDKIKTEDTIPEHKTLENHTEATSSNVIEDIVTNTVSISISKDEITFPNIPDDIEDFDKANWDDPFQVSHYAMHIFEYMKARESTFIIDDYMERQEHLSVWMRSLLVDWMVEVQETFELNHETLYLAVKIVDLYLCRVVINKEKLQLLGAAALFIACKYDERTPPLIEDFLYICDGAYKHDELIQMETIVLRTIDYDLGIPLSYRFLRRYARCAKVPMPTLTLARYILELSLMDYASISFSDSKMACAALFMALRMQGEQCGWTPTLEYYSGYNLVDFADIVPVLNASMHRKPKGTIKTIRSKYSHKIFHEVAKVRLMTNEQLFEHNMDINVTE